MEKLHLFFLSLSFLLPISNSAATTTTAAAATATDFIKSSCLATRYRTLCIQSLSVYAAQIHKNDQHLTQTALSISVATARSATAYVTKISKSRGLKGREYLAVKDCIETMGDSVDSLSQSVKEMDHMGGRGFGGEFMWHMSNVQTWVSSALTDENTCLDGFGGSMMDGVVKRRIRRRVVYVSQITSNALALVNRMAQKHRV